MLGLITNRFTSIRPSGRERSGASHPNDRPPDQLLYHIDGCCATTRGSANFSASFCLNAHHKVQGWIAQRTLEEVTMQHCSVTRSEASQQWPEGIISVKLTMNPYIFAMAIEEAYRQGLQPWELVSLALWEKLGKPDREALTEFAASLDLADDDPDWKKRLKITAAHEAALAAARRERDQGLLPESSTDGDR